MQTSYNWLQDYLDIRLDAEQTGRVLTDIGLEVEGLERRQSVPGGLAGLVVGKVLTCARHPNADRLSLTTVDVGGEAPLQIVCGAPNVAADQHVVVATVGTTLYPSEGEPFKIKAGKIRGEASNGMICAEDEIGLGSSHAGILVLPDAPAPGTPAAALFNVETDYVYDIGLTPNRSDATAHLGVARDLGAALRINYDHDGTVRTPDLSGFAVANTDLPIEVEVKNTAACPRYTGVSIGGVTVGESPDWLKNRLNSIGVRPINNVVDITNFVLHEYGQPLHAFDLDKIAGRRVIVQTLPAGTTFRSLDGETREMAADDLIICDGEGKGMCIAGVFGGADSGVTEATTNIFLESAHFEAGGIRRTSFRHDLRTDAARVFEKGSDPNVTEAALKRAALLLQELAGGTISSEVVDVYPEPVGPAHVRVAYAYVRRLIGVDIPREKIHAILGALGMALVSDDEAQFTVAVPTDKADVTRPADVVEEILRIYGLNEVPVGDRIKSSLSYSPQPDPQRVRGIVTELLVAHGGYEIMALSLSESRHYAETLPLPKEQLVFVNNTSNQHLDILRASMLPGGLEAVVHNQNRRQTDVTLFEFGRTYRRAEGGKLVEREHLSLLLTGAVSPVHWRNDDQQRVDFYRLRALVERVLDRLGFAGYQSSDSDLDALQYGRKYHRGPQELVQLGRVQPAVERAFGAKQPVFYADFHWPTLLKALRRQKTQITEPSRYPSVRRDLALVIDQTVKFEDIAAIARKQAKKLLQDLQLVSVFEDAEKLGAAKKSYAIRLEFANPERTLKDKEVDKVMQQLMQQFERQLHATIRR